MHLHPVHAAGCPECAAILPDNVAKHELRGADGTASLDTSPCLVVPAQAVGGSLLGAWACGGYCSRHQVPFVTAAVGFWEVGKSHFLDRVQQPN